MTHPLLRLGPTVVDLDKLEVRRDEERVSLTPLEAALLRHLSQHLGEAVRREELLERVWGYHPGLATRAPSLLISRLRGKLEPGDVTPRFLKTVRGHGYMLCATLEGGALPSTPGDVLLTLARRARASIDDPALRRELATHAEAIEAEAGRRQGDEAALLLLALADAELLRGEVARLWRASERATEPALKLDCAVAAVRMLNARGHVEAALESVQRVLTPLQPAVSLDTEVARCRLELVRATALGRLGRLDEARAAAEIAIATSTRIGDDGLRMQAHDRRAFVARRGGDEDTATQHHLDAIALMDLRKPREVHVQLLNNFATFLYDQGHLSHARARYRQALQISDTLELPHHSVTLLGNIASIDLAEGRLDDAEDYARATLEQASLLDSGHQMARSTFNLARVDIERRRYPEARAGLQRARHLSDKTGYARLACHAVLLEAWLAQVRGDRAEALALHDEARTRCQALGDRGLLGLALLWRAWLGEPGGDALAAQARDELEAAGSPLARFAGGAVPHDRGGQRFEARRCEELRARLDAGGACPRAT